MRKELDLPSIIMLVATSMGLVLPTIYFEVSTSWKLVMFFGSIILGLLIIVLLRRVDRVREAADKAKRWLIILAAVAVGFLAVAAISWLSTSFIISQVPLRIVLLGVLVLGASVGWLEFWLGLQSAAAKMLLSRPSFLGLPVRVAPTELELTWQGKKGDEVGPGPGQLGADGHDDAVFLLRGRWRHTQQITQIDLFRTDSERKQLGQHWTSSHHGKIWQLGVVGITQEGKVALSRGPWPVNANEQFTFLLYASDLVPPREWFTEGQWYEVLVQHDGGPSTARTCLQGS